jgi:hypothetical protein
MGRYLSENRTPPFKFKDLTLKESLPKIEILALSKGLTLRRK